MPKLPSLIAGMSSVILSLFGCASAETSSVREGELFDGQVSVCYSEQLDNLMKDGKTGVVEIDEATEPSVEALNAVLSNYWMELLPSPQREKGYFSGGIAKWERMCRKPLPDDAVFHDIIAMTDRPENDVREEPFYVSHPLSETKAVDVGRWISKGRLVHLEIRVTDKEYIKPAPPQDD